MNVTGIKQVLPHRYPMLLVDRVAECVPGVRLTAHKAVTSNEPWYAALDDVAEHAYPPVLVIESWCQAACLLATWDQPSPDVLRDRVLLLAGLSGAQLHGRVLPGDTLEHRVRQVRTLGDTMIVEGVATVADRAVLTVQRAVLTMRTARELHPAAARSGAAARSAPAARSGR